MNLEELLETYGDQLYRIGLLLLKNREDTEDAVQETLYKYMRKHPEFKDSGHAGRWLMKVMINECRNIQRFRFRYVPLLIKDIPAMDDNDREVLRTIETLPYKDREVLLLHYSEGYTLKEIAEMLKISLSAVKMRLLRAKKSFAQAYGEELNDESDT